MRPGIRPPRLPFQPFKPEDQMRKPFKKGDKKSENRYSVLAEFPSLPKPNIPLPLKEPITSLSKKPISKDNPSSSGIFIQTKDSYEMKPPETYSQAVVPITPVSKEKISPSNKKEFPITVLQVLPIMALDKEYEGFGVPDLLKPCYTNRNYVETEDPLKTQKYYEFILTDTNSIRIEHKLADLAISNRISYVTLTYLFSHTTIFLLICSNTFFKVYY